MLSEKRNLSRELKFSIYTQLFLFQCFRALSIIELRENFFISLDSHMI